MNRSAAEHLEQAAAAFASITLEEMDGVKLLNRIDTKYLTDEQTLLGVLRDAAAAGYRILETQGKRLCPYNSVYYDTPSLQMFLDHHNARLVRQKVRTREYLTSGTAFLEIKRKNNHGRTKKKRTAIPPAEMLDFSADQAAVDYLNRHSAFRAGQLSPALSTAFHRITLVDPSLSERLTIDSGLLFENFRTGAQASLGSAVIIELKQSGHVRSPISEILLRHRVKCVRISKYCIGTTLTDPQVKHNRFKEKVRTIEKLTQQQIQTL